MSVNVFKPIFEESMAREHSDVLSGRSFSTSQPIIGSGGNRSWDGFCCRENSLIDYMQVTVLFHANYGHVMLRGHEVSGRVMRHVSSKDTRVENMTIQSKGQNKVSAFYDQLLV